MTTCYKALSLLAVLGAGFSAVPTAPASGDTIGLCRTPQLRLNRGAYGEAAGQFRQTFTLTNVSPSTCRLEGWPSLKVQDESGRVEDAKIVRVVQGPPGARPFGRVVLRHRGAASFDVYGADWDARANLPCGRTSALSVTPPAGHGQLQLAVRLPDCGRFFVAPLVVGRSDRDAWSRIWRG